MKKIIFGLIILTVMASCNREKLAQLEQEVEILKSENQVKDSLQDKFNDFLLQIEENITTIKGKEKMISEQSGEKPRSVQDKIAQDLADISDLMDENRKKINELESIRKKLNASNVETSKMKKLVESLEARVAEQDAEIKKLQEDLRIANEQIEALREENRKAAESSAQQQAVIEEQTIALNTAYYVMGNTKTLKELGVITKTGGFIGMGQATILSQDANSKSFTKIDIREVKTIETNSERVFIITPHPESAYELDKTDPKNIKIVIKDVENFWTNSKHLVIRVR